MPSCSSSSTASGRACRSGGQSPGAGRTPALALRGRKRRAAARGGVAVLADACLGVPGRPQSATGQTTLLTGENAARALGRHLLGFPNLALREILTRRSLFRTLATQGRRTAFANAYPVAYLQSLGIPCHGQPEAALTGRRRPRASASTVAFLAGGAPFAPGTMPRRDAASPRHRSAAGALMGRGHPPSLARRGGRDFPGIRGRPRPHPVRVLRERRGGPRSVHGGRPRRTRAARCLSARGLARSARGRLTRRDERPRQRGGPVVAEPHPGARPGARLGPAAERVSEVRDLTEVAGLLIALAGRPSAMVAEAIPGGSR